MAVFRELLTKIGFQVDGNKLRQTNTAVGRAKRNMGVAARQARQLRRDMSLAAGAAKAWAAVFVGSRILKTFTTDYAKGADEVAKFSTALSLNTETYQGLVHAVKLGGSDQENLNKALSQLSKRALEAGQGLKTNQRAFRDAGVDWKDAEGNLKGGDQLFLELADGLNNLKDKNAAAGLSMQLMGRTGIKLRNTMQLGSKAIKEQIKQAKELGIVLSREQLKAAEDFNDEMLRAKSIMVGVRNQIAAKLLPAITRNMKAFQLWAREGDNLKRALMKVRIAAKILGAALALLVATKLGRWARAGVQSLKTLVIWFKAAGRAALFAQAKMLLIVAVIALIVLAIEDLVGFAQGRDSLLGRTLGDTKQATEIKKMINDVVEAFKEMGRVLLPAFGELWVALKPLVALLWKGFVKALPFMLQAAKVAIVIITIAIKGLVIGVKAVINAVIAIGRWFKRVDKSVNKSLDSMTASVKATWNTIIDWIVAKWNWLATTVKGIINSIGTAFTDAAGWVGRAWDKVINGLKSGFDTVITAAEEALTIKGLLEDKPIKWMAQARALVQAQESRRAGITAAISAGRPGGGSVVQNNSARLGQLVLNVSGSTNMTPEQISATVRDGALKALQDLTTEVYRNRAPVVK